MNPGGAITTVRPDGSGLRTLGPTAIFAADPEWSPDGTMIAFAGDPIDDPEPTSEVYVMDADGSDLRQVTSGLGIVEGPHWSPDGSTIGYYRLSERRVGVWTVSLATGSVSRLTSDPSSADRPGYWYGLAYSPDGTRIVYTRGGDLWLMDPKGGYQHRLDAGRERDCASVCSPSRRFTPSWAPDGSKLVYTTALNAHSRYRGEQLLRVNVLDLSTEQHHVVGDLTVTGSSPPVWWSNDELLVRPVLGR